MTHAAWPRRSWLPDMAIATALVIVAATTGYRYISAHYTCQNCVEDLIYPCLRQFGRAPEAQTLQKVPEYQAFWQQKLGTIPCRAVAGLPTAPIGQAWDLQKYLHAVVSGVMLLTGPRLAGFHLVLTTLFALTSLASYGVFRLGMGRIVAAAATVALIFSELHLHQTTDLADYAKAPFIVGALFFAGLALRRPVSRRRLIVLSLLSGSTAGIGIGFKPDVLVCVPILALALALFVPSSTDGRRTRQLTAASVFLAAALAASAPMIAINFFGPSGSLLPVQVLGGMDRSFDDYHAAPSMYDYGIVFHDLYVTLQINSYNQRVYGAREFVHFFSKGMARAAARLVIDLDWLFPADLIARVLAAVARILALAPFGWAATAVVLIALFATNVRLGLCVMFLLLTYVGYTSLVFVPRHYFHTQFVPLWMIGVLAHQSAAAGARWIAAAPAPDWGAVARGVAVLAALCGGIGVVLAGARMVQQSRVGRVIASYDRDENLAALDLRPVERDGALLRVDVNGGLARGAFDPPSTYTVAANYLVVDIDCTAPADSTIVTSYHRPDSWQQESIVRCSTGARRWRLFLPTYDVGPDTRLRGIAWKVADPLRVRSIRKVRDLAVTPMLLKLVLPEDWRQQPLYHRFSLAALERPQLW